MRDRLAQKGNLASLAERAIDEMELIRLAEASDDQKLSLRRESQRRRLARAQIGVERIGGIERAIRDPVIHQTRAGRGRRRIGGRGKQKRGTEQWRQKNADHYSYVPKARG